MNTCTEEEEKVSSEISLEIEKLIKQQYPEKNGYNRKIKFLFDQPNKKYYRINFHQKEPPHYIKYSHYIEIKDGTIKEWKD